MQKMSANSASFIFVFETVIHQQNFWRLKMINRTL